MKKRKAFFLFALIPLIALAGCARNASDGRMDSPNPSGGAVELADIAGHPQEAPILEGLRRGLYAAPSDGLFRPDEPVTRGEFAVTLWNLAGQPDAPGKNAPSDGDGALRHALSWLDGRGFLDAASFRPDEPLTRQEAMNLLYAYNGGAGGLEAMLTGIYDDAFSDSAQIPAGGKPALYWGFYNVLIVEPEPDKIAPDGAVSRGDMAAMMVRYMDDFQSEPPNNE